MGADEVEASREDARVVEGIVRSELLVGKTGTWDRDSAGMPNDRPVWKNTRA